MKEKSYFNTSLIHNWISYVTIDADLLIESIENCLERTLSSNYVQVDWKNISKDCLTKVLIDYQPVRSLLKYSITNPTLLVQR